MRDVKGKCTGTIGRDNMAPQERWLKDDEGKDRPWRFFSMFVDNNRQGPRTVATVTLPNNKRGEKLFHALREGRRVFVEGTIRHKPKVGKNADGEQVAYENMHIKVDDLLFLDTPKLSQYRNTLEDMSTAGLIDDAQKDQYLEALSLDEPAPAEFEDGGQEEEDL